MGVNAVIPILKILITALTPILRKSTHHLVHLLKLLGHHVLHELVEISAGHCVVVLYGLLQVYYRFLLDYYGFLFWSVYTVLKNKNVSTFCCLLSKME